MKYYSLKDFQAGVTTSRVPASRSPVQARDGSDEFWLFTEEERLCLGIEPEQYHYQIFECKPGLENDYDLIGHPFEWSGSQWILGRKLVDTD